MAAAPSPFQGQGLSRDFFSVTQYLYTKVMEISLDSRQAPVREEDPLRHGGTPVTTLNQL